MNDKKEILFPHDKIREIQDKFIEDVVKCSEKGGGLIAHVPTGIGKTAAVIGPLLSHALKRNLTIFFVTPRHTQHRIAIDTVRMINQKHGLKICAVDFIGKKWMCPIARMDKLSSSQFAEYCREMRENGTCEFYSRYRSKKRKVENEILIEKIKKEGAMHCQDMVKLCTEAGVCPYEIGCDVAKSAKVIIADYFHVLSKSIRENLFKKTEKTMGASVIVFDEGHNLPDRCKDLMSSSLSTRVIELAKKEAKELGDFDVVEKLEEVEGVMKELSGRLGENEDEMAVKKEDFSGKLEKYADLIMKLDLIAEKTVEKKKKSYAGWVAGFLGEWIGQDNGFVRTFEKVYFKKKKQYKINYLCLDPSLIMKPVIESSYAVICMSGTMTPTSMYKDLFGFDKVCEVEYSSPFPKENVLNLIMSGVSTKFTLRSDEMYKRIAEMCAMIVNEVPGNSFVFFPSYDFRDKVYKFCENLFKKTTFLEMSRMSKSERENVLAKFKSYKDRGACLLGVSNGSFSEGVDLPGDYLKAVVVVGIPLARPDLQTKALIDYYDGKFDKGWDYGYIYPAIITAVQNAGRCIRSETDRGVIVFMDERYSWDKYLRCFPKDMRVQLVSRPEVYIRKFFDTAFLKNKDNTEKD